MSSSPNLSRRSFLRGKVASSASQLLSTVVRPPWAMIESLFIDNCTRCSDCVDACPEGILVQGDGGFPEVSFQRGECTFCAECVKSCPTNALNIPFSKINAEAVLSPKRAWNLDVSIGTNCFSLNAVVCRSCGDNCEPQAIQFKLKVGGISEPQISQDDCTGCGACVSVCPVDAVLIKPNLTRSIAA